MKLITYETYYLCQGFTNVLENSLKKKKMVAVLPVEMQFFHRRSNNVSLVFLSMGRLRGELITVCKFLVVAGTLFHQIRAWQDPLLRNCKIPTGNEEHL